MAVFNGKIHLDKDAETNSITSASTVVGLGEQKATSNQAMVVQYKAIAQNPMSRLAGANPSKPQVGFKEE